MKVSLSLKILVAVFLTASLTGCVSAISKAVVEKDFEESGAIRCEGDLEEVEKIILATLSEQHYDITKEEKISETERILSVKREKRKFKINLIKKAEFLKISVGVVSSGLYYINPFDMGGSRAASVFDLRTVIYGALQKHQIKILH